MICEGMADASQTRSLSTPLTRSNSLTLAHNLSLTNDIIGMINCPINKNVLDMKNIGVTEYLASKCKIVDNSEAMLIKSDKLAVCPITTHLPIKLVSKKIHKKKFIIEQESFIINFFSSSINNILIISYLCI